jgi:hypothetical protein
MWKRGSHTRKASSITAVRPIMSRKNLLSAGVQKENTAGVQKEKILERVISQDFGPVVERWAWGLCDCPELA